ncbi:cysteine proteinase [Anaeromyces robustus]|uniref:ubiquitinyl hydrolase 1 n=1 Tax=Anaeromyces robustus TaxID=1754192 RepID=A0A1Y1WE43_9FUNG|nr:cysteine proteinase [Anaeromyces robustus]|eukprot:ORX71732.1 cysteine proteinase [Anaeromyces robustus]
MVRNSNINNCENFENNNNSDINNSSDSGNNSEEIETNNNIAFKRMKITSETDQDINISQPKSLIMDNDTSNSDSLIDNDDSSNDYSITEFSTNKFSTNNQINTPMDSYSSSNYPPEQMNNIAMSNSRDDNKDNIYQAGPVNDNSCTALVKQDDNSSISDDDLPPPPAYEDLYPTSVSKFHTPGTNGLGNLGNTCFMNSGLQCIAHTALLRDYLLKGYWKKELNLTSIHSMKGKMVKAFVKVLENLWSNNSGPYRPTEFKSVISKHTPSFEGYHQHDCQEFIASLLDGLHEDINRVKEKKFEEYPDMNDMADEEAASTSWGLHIRRENSIIVDLFYGQYRSINICQTCNTKRLNFEPFVYLTLPIPENQEIEVPVQILLDGKYIETVRINVLKSNSIALMKEKIAEKIKEENIITDIEIDKNNLEIFQGREYTMNAYLSNSELVENIQSLEHSYYSLYAYIVTSHYSLNSIKNHLQNPKEDNKLSNINIPVYQKVEDADRYSNDDNGFPFLINLPNLAQFEDDEKMINRRLLGWAIYREIVKYYQKFTEYTIATMDPTVELDPKVLECINQIREEEENLNKKISNHVNVDNKSTSSSKDSEDNSSDDNADDTNINKNYNDDDFDSQQGNASSNNDGNLSDINDSLDDAQPIQKKLETEEEVNAMNDDEDTLLENTYKATHAKQTNVVISDNDVEMSSNKESEIINNDENNDKKEEDVEVLYPINDGWKVMSKLFDVQLIYSEKPNESFYSYSFSYSCPRVILYNTKDNSSKEDDSSNTRNEYRSYSYRNNQEYRSAKVSIKPKDCLIIITWKPALLKLLFGENKFDCFTPKASKQTVKKPESKPITLEECIKEFIKDEILTDENKWFCPHCKEDREAYKKMDIWKAPEILIVHLKRFIQDRRYYSSRKNNVLVKFPIEGLDLTDVIIGDKSEEKYIYNLYAISNHSGSTGGGHYTAYVKNDKDGKWYDCNDSFVSEVSESSIVTPSAYLLFYERCHEPGKEFQLPNLDNVPDVYVEEEEEINYQNQINKYSSMPLPMPGSLPMRNGPPSDTMNNPISTNYGSEDFADFDNMNNNVYTSTATAPANNSLSNLSSSDLNSTSSNDILYDDNDDNDQLITDTDTVVEEKGHESIDY